MQKNDSFDLNFDSNQDKFFIVIFFITHHEMLRDLIYGCHSLTKFFRCRGRN